MLASEAVMDAQVSRFEWYGVLLLVVAAAFLRFYELGRMDTRGDEVELLEFMQAKYQPAQYWNFTWEAFKTNRQMPLPRVSTCALIRLFRMDDSLIAIRLPFAVIGTLTIPALFLLGLYLGHKRLAWTLAALGAINPYNIFWARFAHVYAFPMLFVTLTVAFFAAILRSVSRGEMPQRKHLVLAALSSILAAYSHMSTWPAV
ncbi:MAG: hypothetical protein HY343_02120, partial [Lentisphaerae bacterium]|nr:hypothetical protein [Lentisphaerota bacterium]